MLKPTTEHRKTGFIRGFNPGEIYDYPIKNMTTAGVFRYAGVDVIPLRDRCARCGRAISRGGSFFSKYGAKRYGSEHCRKFGDWRSTRDVYEVVSIDDMMARAMYYICEVHNDRT